MTEINPYEAFIFAVYPFLLLMAGAASYICAWAAWRLRKTRIVTWWLLVGISIALAMMCVDTIWYAAYRLQADGYIYVGEWANRASRGVIPFHAAMRAVSAVGATFVTVTGLCLVWNKRGGSTWVKWALKRTFLYGTAAYLVLATLVFLLML